MVSAFSAMKFNCHPCQKGITASKALGDSNCPTFAPYNFQCICCRLSGSSCRGTPGAKGSAGNLQSVPTFADPIRSVLPQDQTPILVIIGCVVGYYYYRGYTPACMVHCHGSQLPPTVHPAVPSPYGKLIAQEWSPPAHQHPPWHQHSCVHQAMSKPTRPYQLPTRRPANVRVLLMPDASR